MAREMAWVRLFCRGSGCGVRFYICHSCYRGQVYCGEGCRRRMRRQQMRRANRKHQQSREGRLDHRDRQRVYRKKCRLRRVTDHTSARRPRSVNIKKPWTKQRRRPPFLGGISASAAMEAVSSRHPARLHCVWAHAGVIGPERGAVIDERNGSTARRCSRSKPRMNFGRRRRQVNRWNSRMNSLPPKEAHFDVLEKEEDPGGT